MAPPTKVHTTDQLMLQNTSPLMEGGVEKGVDYGIKDANGLTWDTNADKREAKEKSLWYVSRGSL